MSGTPADLAARVDALLAEQPDVAKLACLAHDARDALRMLGETRRCASSRRVMLLSMGSAAVAQRVLARKVGAFAVFAAVEESARAAPGQPTLRELRERYHWERIGAQTRVYGVMGWPVAHSRGPDVHNAALRNAGIDGVYVPFPVAPEEAACFEFLDAAIGSGWLDLRGLSVTLPHKEHALRWLQQRGGRCTAGVEACGALNTLIRAADGTWWGENTDVLGVRHVLRAVGAPAAVAVLGAGGAARAVVVALRELGWDVCIYNRTAARAVAMAAEFGCRSGAWERRAAGGEALVVNCTQVGMAPEIDATPLPAEALHGRRAVFDTIYTPAVTRLLREARSAGCLLLSGREMFLAQAEAQFRCWHEQPPPAGVMQAALANIERLAEPRP